MNRFRLTHSKWNTNVGGSVHSKHLRFDLRRHLSADTANRELERTSAVTVSRTARQSRGERAGLRTETTGTDK